MNILLYPFFKSPSPFAFQTMLLQHGSSKKCLAITESKQRLVMEECNSSSLHQQWKFENYDATKL